MYIYLPLSSPTSLPLSLSLLCIFYLLDVVCHTQCNNKGLTLKLLNNTFTSGCYDEHCIQGRAQNSTSGHGPDYSWCKPRCKTGRSALNGTHCKCNSYHVRLFQEHTHTFCIPALFTFRFFTIWACGQPRRRVLLMIKPKRMQPGHKKTSKW